MKNRKRILIALSMIVCVVTALCLCACLGGGSSDECSHEWSKWKTKTSATCATDGLKTRECSLCGEVEEKVVSATGHTPSDWIVDEDATCTNSGSQHKECLDCGEKLATEEIKALGHTGGEATCTQKAICSVCGEEYGKLDSNKHDFGDWIKKEPATCTETGVKAHKTCKLCGKHFDSNDNEIENLIIKALEHDITLETVTAPTCTESGVGREVCSRCDYENTVTLPANGHTSSGWIVDGDSSCLIGGTKHKECTECGEILETAEIPIGSHNESDWIIDTEATCTEVGSKHKECTICHTIFETEEIGVLGHDIVHHNAQEATCTEVGWEAYDTCSRCDYSTYVEIKAKGHTPSDWIIDTEATCTETGSKHKECTSCHAVLETEEIDVLGHDIVSHQAQAPTCTAVGWEAYDSCSRCDYSTYAEIEATGHTSSDWIVDKEASGTETGSKHKECTICFEVLNTEEIPKLATYNVTFMVDGDSYCTIQLTSKDTISIPSNPSKEDYVFVGWYTDVSCTIALDTSATISEDIVIYAKWKVYDDGYIIVSADTYNFNDKELTLKEDAYLSSDTTEYDLRNKFTVSTGASWRAFTSPECSQPTELTLRKATLTCGWNDVYIMVENQTTYEYRIYNLKIYRCPEIEYNILDDGTYELTSVENYYDVRFTANDRDKITHIGSNAFASCKSVTQVQTLPNLVEIGESAFADCVSLASFVFPETLTTISECAFNSCIELTDISIPNSVSEIGQSAFSGCSNITKISGAVEYVSAIIEQSNTTSTIVSIIITNGDSIGDETFSGCSALTSITIPNSVTSIGSSAFSGCSALTSVTIPDSVMSIGEEPFSGCTGLTSVHITNLSAWCGIEFVYGDSNPLYYAHNLYLNGTLVTDLVIPNDVTEIKAYAFVDTTSLTSITIPDNVTSIGSYAFSDCKGLTSVMGSVDNVSTIIKQANSTAVSAIITSGTYIGSSAFYNCAGLTSVTIPDSVTSIGGSAFDNCTGLTEINYNATNCGNLSSYNYVFSKAGQAGTGIKVTIGANVKSVPAYLFCPNSSRYSSLYAPNITEVVFEEGSVCESIGSYAFDDCSSLTSVTISDSVTSIGQYAFSGCTSLTSVTIPDSVTSIGSSAFDYCYKLVEVYNKSSLTITAGSSSYGYIAYYAKAVYTEEYVSKLSIDENGYIIYTDGEEKILIGYTGTETELTLPESITEINKYAFAYNTSIISVTIPDSVTSIGSSAFEYCTSLTSVTIGSSVTSIEKYAFYNCTGLTSVTIPDSVTSIGSYAFYGCSNLTSITFDDTSTWYCTTSYSDWNNKTDGTKVSVSNASTNATDFTSTYCNYYWYKI